MSESPRKRQRTTPRNSEGPEAQITPYSDLRQLAGVIPKPITPFRRASSAGAGPTPGSRRTPNIAIRTPKTATRTPHRRPGTRPNPTRRAAPTTPHAIRALRERANAARTPGHNRRRSGRIQRETPRDTLRDLSRLLARTTRPVDPSPQVQARTPRNPALELPDIDDGPEPVRPRLSMPLEDMYDDDSIHEAPPRQSLLPQVPDDVDNGTIHSLEFGRRALSEDPRQMYGGRLSERFAEFGDMIPEEEYEVDGTFIRQNGLDDQFLQDAIDNDMDDTTTDLRALARRSGGRPSDVTLGVFGDQDEPDDPTFVFTLPQRIQAAPQEQPEEGYEDEEAQDEEQPSVGAGIDVIYDDDDDDDDEPMAAYDAQGWESDEEIHNDQDLMTYREEASAMDRSLRTQSPERAASTKGRPGPRSGRQRKEMFRTDFGDEYPSFPAATVKRLATGFAKSQGDKAKISKDTLQMLVSTTDLFFKQIGGDLAAYADHAGRKTVEEKDVLAVMKRQRTLTSNTTAFSLAQKILPRELLQQLRMEPPPKLRGQKRKRMETIEEENDE
ncbi:hypothetical protein P154DRAFT_558714 [Amniculicola lignicola CBS 123094]|uniref:CENP-T/Histone H4 histone fold domain-containing protein n=1 Tax=Amniculicola lignicola CBS 123094 TaxID=1392246 RepID=A0A6A5X3K9_9PLEO|nr:hypothetical protein P154DRAFT_558714 [Amniculicola lignicola CBS 123094]